MKSPKAKTNKHSYLFKKKIGQFVGHNHLFLIFTVPESVPSVPARKFDKSALEESDSMKIKAPEIVRQFLAETLGTFLLVLFGNGAIAQKSSFGEDLFMPIAFGYGFALMIGIMVKKFSVKFKNFSSH